MVTPSPLLKDKKPLSSFEVTKIIDKCVILLRQEPPMVDAVERAIKDSGIPYQLVKLPDGVFKIQSILSRGEQFLQSFISQDLETTELKESSRKIAKTKYEVLIVGETGTGKEILAKSMIADREGPIKAVNCAGFPEQLIESELFGHVKGSFTGADRDKKGLLVEANKGIMFLDEIGELPMSVQAKLLRALQEKKIRPVGGNNDIDITCKFVCATHRDLTRMVEEGKFRQDLYARISTLELHIKPLRDRKCDLVPITKSIDGGEQFLERYEQDLVNGLIPYPLNVRSLQQHVIRFNVLGKLQR